MILLAPRDAARRINRSVSRLVQLDREGLLPAIRDSAGRRLYDADRIDEFVRQREARRVAAAAASSPAQEPASALSTIVDGDAA